MSDAIAVADLPVDFVVRRSRSGASITACTDLARQWLTRFNSGGAAPECSSAGVFAGEMLADLVEQGFNVEVQEINP